MFNLDFSAIFQPLLTIALLLIPLIFFFWVKAIIWDAIESFFASSVVRFIVFIGLVAFVIKGLV